MKKIGHMNIGELAAYVCTLLNSKGIKCVLTGGACVSIYSENKYLSYDLDFVDITYSSQKKIKQLLTEAGFTEKNRYYTHPETNYFLDFPPGPLSAGAEPITDIREIDYTTGKLFILSAGDSVKDRLSAYYHWGDTQALEQAIMVAQNNKTDLKEIKKWSEDEGYLDKYNNIKEKLKHKSK